MTSGQWLTAATTQLKTAGVSSAKLDALILLEDCLAVERSHILAHPEIKLKASQIKKLNKQVARRALHEPLAYIRGFSEFYGRQFMVNKHVLEPRPESETMITLLKNLLYHNPSISEDGPLKITTNERIAKIADVGTGSGCLGITATLEISGSQVDLYDTDTKALVVAKHNMALHGLHLRTSRCDLLSNCHSSYDVIVANLPYLPDRWQIDMSISREPAIAFFGGPDGLDLYRRLFDQISHFSWRPKYILTESLPLQHKELLKIAKNHGYKEHTEQDFIQIFETSP